MNTQQLIAEVDLLPVEERARIVEHLLESLTMDTPGNLEAWIDVARQRRDEIQSGRVQAVPAEDVFQRFSDRFGK